MNYTNCVLVLEQGMIAFSECLQIISRRDRINASAPMKEKTIEITTLSWSEVAETALIAACFAMLKSANEF